MTVAGAVAIAGLMTPLVTDGPLAVGLSRLPRVGHQFANLFEAVRMYRRQPQVLAIAGADECCRPLPVRQRGLLRCPGPLRRGAAAGDALRGDAVERRRRGFAPSRRADGRGAWNIFTASLRRRPGWSSQPGQGLVVALGYRMIGILIAAVGVIYYLASRREVAAVMHEAEAGHAGPGRRAAGPEMFAARPAVRYPPN